MPEGAGNGRCRGPARALLAVLLVLLLQLSGCHAGDGATTANSSSLLLPAGLEGKPLIEQLLARKAALAQHLRSDAWARRMQRLQDGFAAAPPELRRGVLIVAGSRDHFANAAVTLRVLRGVLRSSVPVELVHFGQAEAPPPQLMALFAALNGSSSAGAATTTTPAAAAAGGPAASTSTTSSSSTNASSSGHSSSLAGFAAGPVFVTDALAAAPPGEAAGHHRALPGGIKGFAAKVYALTHVTRFRQVLLLDADSMPLVDPLLLFHTPLFQRSGSLLWPDLWHSAWVNETIYSLVGGLREAPWLGKRHHRLVDSGQLLIDRLRHAEVLEYLWLLNSHHEWVYKHMHGDKDTFFLAFAMAGRLQAFKQVASFARDAMRHVPGHQHAFHHLGMVQSMPAGMLVAALRAAARSAAAKQEQQQHGAGGSGDDAPPAAVVAAAALGRRGGPAGHALLSRSSSSSSSSSSSRHTLLLPPPPWMAPAVGAAAAAGGSDGPAALPARARALLQPGSSPPAEAAAARSTLRHVGVPVFFHRTSFNSKFFPDCLSADKLRSHYCEVQWVSVPLSNEQAGHSLKPNMYGFNAEQVDTRFYAAHCASRQGNSSASRQGSSSRGGAQQQQQQQQQQLASSWVASGLGLDTAAGAGAAGGRHLVQGAQEEVATAASSSSSRALRACRWLQQQQQQQPWARRLPSRWQQVLLQAVCGARRDDNGGGTSLAPRAGSSSSRQRRQRQQQHAHSGAASRRHLQQQQPGVHRWPLLQEAGFALPPEHACDRLPVGEDVVPIPVMPLEAFPHMAGVLAASYEAFAAVRAALGVEG